MRQGFEYSQVRAQPGWSAQIWAPSLCRTTIQDVGNILGALYLSMLFLGIINSRTVQPVAAAERAVSLRCHEMLPAFHQPWLSALLFSCVTHELVRPNALPAPCAPQAP